jgi:microcystin-dependent protein
MSDPYYGEIRMFAGNFAPVGWLLCQGQLLPISGNEALYTLLGTTYGGDGDVTFALPNLIGRFPLHQSTSYPIGAMGGAESVIVTTSTMPQHTHSALAGSAAGTSTSPSGNVWASGTTTEYTSTAPSTTMNPAALSSVGGSVPHDNMPPFVAVNFIIATTGIFPSAG